VNTNSAQFPTGRALPTRAALAGNYDIESAPWTMTSGSGSLLSPPLRGGSDTTLARKLSLDASGNLLLTVYTFSSISRLPRNALQPLYGGKQRCFVLGSTRQLRQFLLTPAIWAERWRGGVRYRWPIPAGFLYITGLHRNRRIFPPGERAPTAIGARHRHLGYQVQNGPAGLSGLQWSTMPAAKGPTPVWLWWWARTDRVRGRLCGKQFQASSNATQGAVRWRFSDGLILVVRSPRRVLMRIHTSSMFWEVFALA